MVTNSLSRSDRAISCRTMAIIAYIIIQFNIYEKNISRMLIGANNEKSIDITGIFRYNKNKQYALSRVVEGIGPMTPGNLHYMQGAKSDSYAER